MKCVIYARFSSDNQRVESITAQLRACREFAMQKGWVILCEYIDEAQSATTDDRVNFLNMIDAITTGRERPDVVLVHKLDRFARNKIDSGHYR
ncbi:MAG TPA: recombinase family protein, partial [Armatimonadota bacterium]